jgi:hypothetical protein
MSLFQLVVVPPMAALAVWNVYRATQTVRRRKIAIFSCILWLTAGASVLRPQLVTVAARTLGIGRGADLVLYFFCLIVLLLALYVYGRIQKLESALTDVVRHLTLQNPSGGQRVDANRSN